MRTRRGPGRDQPGARPLGPLQSRSGTWSSDTPGVWRDGPGTAQTLVDASRLTGRPLVGDESSVKQCPVPDTSLLTGHADHYRAQDWEYDEFGSSLNGYKTVKPGPLVIVEGVTCTRSEATERLCYRIWVEAPEGLRLERGVEREMARRTGVAP